MDLEAMLKTTMDTVITGAPSVLKALLLVFIGFSVANAVSRGVSKLMEVQKFDPTIRSFMSSLLGVGIKIFVLISAAGTLGIETTSFAAALGGSFLAIGIALQGTLSHLGGGFLILIFKPFRVGDLIVAQGFTGRVKEIQLFSTIITTADNQTIIIPNGAVASGTTQNISLQGTRRIETSFTITGNPNIDNAREIIRKVLVSNELVLKDPAPEITVTAVSASSVTFAVRPWANVGNYEAVHSYTLEHVKKAIEAAGLSL